MFSHHKNVFLQESYMPPPHSNTQPSWSCFDIILWMMLEENAKGDWVAEGEWAWEEVKKWQLDIRVIFDVITQTQQIHMLSLVWSTHNYKESPIEWKLPTYYPWYTAQRKCRRVQLQLPPSCRRLSRNCLAAAAAIVDALAGSTETLCIGLITCANSVSSIFLFSNW